MFTERMKVIRVGKPRRAKDLARDKWGDGCAGTRSLRALWARGQSLDFILVALGGTGGLT